MSQIRDKIHRIAATRPVTWLYLHLFPHIDRILLRISKGRLSVSVGEPIVLLETRGVKTGKKRTIPLFYAKDGKNIILIASKGGSSRHPAWYHNLKASPEALLTFQGRRAKYLAREASGEEREKLWKKAVNTYSGYEVYQRRAGHRTIPIMLLTPSDSNSA